MKKHPSKPRPGLSANGFSKAFYLPRLAAAGAAVCLAVGTVTMAQSPPVTFDLQSGADLGRVIRCDDVTIWTQAMRTVSGQAEALLAQGKMREEPLTKVSNGSGPPVLHYVYKQPVQVLGHPVIGVGTYRGPLPGFSVIFAVPIDKLRDALNVEARNFSCKPVEGQKIRACEAKFPLAEPFMREESDMLLMAIDGADMMLSPQHSIVGCVVTPRLRNPFR